MSRLLLDDGSLSKATRMIKKSEDQSIVTYWCIYFPVFEGNPVDRINVLKSTR